MPRNKCFKAAAPVLEKSNGNLDTRRSKLPTHSKAYSLPLTKGGGPSRSPLDEDAHVVLGINSGAHSIPSTSSGAYSVPATDMGARSIAPTKTRPHLVPQTSSGPHSHSMPPTQRGPTNTRACSMPQTSSSPRSHSVLPTQSKPTKTRACSMPHTSTGARFDSDPSYIPPSHSSDPEVEDVDSFDEYEDDLLPTSSQTVSSSRKNNNYWIVSVIDEDDTIKEAQLKVPDVWSLPIGRKVIVKTNEFGQAIGDAGGLLGGFLGLLGSDFSKFPICCNSWRKVPNKDTMYEDIIQKKFHYKDDRLKGYIIKGMGKIWRHTRHNLFHQFYDETLTFEENVANRPPGIDENHWRLFLDYRLSEKTQEICKKNADNRMKQLYTHTGGSKSISRRKDEEERQRGSRISRGEVWTMVHKRKDGSYIHHDAEIVGEEIMNIEREDNSSKEFSQTDSLSRVLVKEHSGRVRGMGSGPSPTQIFGHTAHQFSGMSLNTPVDHVFQTEMTEMKSQLEAERLKVQNLQSEMEAERLRRQDLQSEMEAERLRRQAFEGAVAKLLMQMQGDNRPNDLAAMINALF